MSILSIFIMCHNRPQETREAVLSILHQTDADFEFTISDNSTTDEVEQLVKSEFPQVDYIRHRPMTLDHINRCVERAKTPYVCIFHDDDLMGPDFVAEMKHAIARHPEAVAIGCNAIIQELGQPQSCLSFTALGDTEWIDSGHALAARYFSRHQMGIAPFPCYVYKKASARAVPFPTGGGKYADVSWLLSLARTGPFVWINKPLMIYRLHNSNDGRIESRRDRLRLLRFIKKNVHWLGKDILDDYRCSFIYKPVFRQPADHQPTRHRIASAFLRGYAWRRYARPGNYVAAVRRAWIKAQHSQ
jgi:glycosyltransferase involved in cell wall biosynthesis